MTKIILTRIAQMTLCLTDIVPGFWYKNHYVIGRFGVLIWLTRWVKAEAGVLRLEFCTVG